MELCKLDVSSASKLLQDKDISSVELTEAYIKKIETYDEKIESYITNTFDIAINKAKEVDEKRVNGKNLSKIAGIPMSLKDNICTKNILTTASSKILGNFIPPYNATLWQKLTDNDAVLLGKTSLDEFAMGASNETSYFKKTKNPYDLGRVPGGSSGGSAAAVSADMCAYSIGSDTGGSVRQPAAYCGVVGIKPTYGRISRYGLIAFASSLDQAGVLAKSSLDAAMILDSICGLDPMDSTTSGVNGTSFTGDIDENFPMKKIKIGIPKEHFADGISHEIKSSILSAIEVYKSLGAEIEEFSIPIIEYALPAYYIISSAEASSNLARYDGVRFGYRSENVSDLSSLYEKTRAEGFGTEVKRRIMLGTYALSSGYYDAYYKKAMKVRAMIIENFKDIFTKYDAIITPVTVTTAFKCGEKLTDPVSMYLADICTVSANLAGIPAMSIPCGYDEKGLPIGMQILTKQFDEAKLLNIANAFEQAGEFKKISPQIT